MFAGMAFVAREPHGPQIAPFARPRRAAPHYLAIIKGMLLYVFHLVA